MSESPAVSEGFLQDQLNQSKLPPLWQLIYNEGIRGNHILFKKGDIGKFDEQEASYDGSSLEESNAMDHFQKTIVAIVSKPELSGMSAVIESLSDDFKIAVFIYYKRMLKAWGAYLKISLH